MKSIYWDSICYRLADGKIKDDVVEVWNIHHNEDLVYDSFRVFEYEEEFYMFTLRREQNSSWYGYKISLEDKKELMDLEDYWEIRKYFEYLENSQGIVQNNIKELLETKSVSIYQMAKDLNLSYPSAHSLVNRKDLFETKFGNLLKIADYLDVSIEDLYK